MSTETEELRTKVSFDTSDVDRGQQRVERALDRMAKAEDASERRLVQGRARHLRDMERLGEASARRTSRISSGLNQIGGVVPGASAISRMMETGGRTAGPAAIAAIVVQALRSNSRLVNNTQDLQRAMGEAIRPALSENPSLSPFVKMLPRWMQGIPETGSPERQSAEGIAGQRAEIQAAVEKVQGERGGMSGFVRAFGKVAVQAIGGPIGYEVARQLERREANSFAAEERAQDKLLKLDQRAGGIIHRDTAADRMGVFGSERAGVIAKAEAEEAKKKAALTDSFNSGKIGVAERDAGYKQAASAREVTLFQDQRARETERRQLALTSRTAYIAGRGQDVEQRTAGARLATAQQAVNRAVTPEELERTKAARDVAAQAYADAEKSTRERKASQRVEMEIASFRGTAQERVLQGAEKEVEKQRELLAIAKERGADATRAAEISLAAAERSRDETKLGLATASIERGSSIALGKIGERSAQFASGLPLGSTSEQKQFDAQNALQRRAADDAIEAARVEYATAEKKIEAEKASQNGKASEDSLADEARAAQAINIALSRRKILENEIQKATAERTADLGRESRLTKSRTRAMRLDDAGRPDLASLESSRSQSEEEAAELERKGKPEMAEEIRRQQRQRETGMAMQRMYGPDGRKRPQREINAENRERRKTQRRRESAMDRLRTNGGRVNGRDPITGESISDQSVGEQRIQDERAPDQTGLTGLITGSVTPSSGLQTGTLRGGSGLSSDDEWGRAFSAKDRAEQDKGWKSQFERGGGEAEDSDERRAPGGGGAAGQATVVHEVAKPEKPEKNGSGAHELQEILQLMKAMVHGMGAISQV